MTQGRDKIMRPRKKSLPTVAASRLANAAFKALISVKWPNVAVIALLLSSRACPLTRVGPTRHVNQRQARASPNDDPTRGASFDGLQILMRPLGNAA